MKGEGVGIRVGRPRMWERARLWGGGSKHHQRGKEEDNKGVSLTCRREDGMRTDRERVAQRI